MIRSVGLGGTIGTPLFKKDFIENDEATPNWLLTVDKLCEKLQSFKSSRIVVLNQSIFV